MSPTILFCLLALGACGETVEIQKQYTASRDTCQLYAEGRINLVESRNQGESSSKARNTKLVESFNQCMNTHSWDMGKPKDVAVAAKPKTPPPTELRNTGVGIGVGPTYHLEEVPVEGSTAHQIVARRPSSYTAPEVSIAPPNGSKPVISREISAPQGAVESVQGRVPEITVKREDVVSTAVLPVTKSSLPPVTADITTPPSQRPPLVHSSTIAPSAPAPQNLSPETEKKLRAVLQDWQ